MHHARDRKVLLFVTAALMVAIPIEGSAFAQQATKLDSTRIARVGGRTLSHSTIIHMPADELFAHFTTAEGIVKAWSVAKAKVDFRVGGQIRTAYNADADLDAPTSIVNTILAFEPNRMITIKATAPAGAPEWLQLVCREAFSVITFEPVSPLATRLTITGVGYGEGEMWDQAYAFFDKGNQWTLDEMKRKLGPGDEDGAAGVGGVMELLRSFEGDWVFETTGPNGKPFYGRTRFDAIVDGTWIGADGWLGGEEGMSPHAHWVAGVNPATGMVEYTNYFEKGHIGTGHIALVAPNTLGFEMLVYTAGGAQEVEAGEGVASAPAPPQKMYVEFEKKSDDAFVSRMYKGIDRRTEGAKPMMELPYTRVAAVPEKFLRVKGEAIPGEPAPSRR
ncbi:MAG: SRPBCC domain-containing protein [Phycisphaeraceae bacterium]|nr:SRPBCC domain-containing protein [Phycisphaeraceae bacterium]